MDITGLRNGSLLKDCCSLHFPWSKILLLLTIRYPPDDFCRLVMHDTYFLNGIVEKHRIK